MGEKICRQCGISKQLEQYNKQSAAKDGHTNVCRLCCSARNKERYNDPEFDKQKYINDRKEWNKDHPKKLYRYIKRYRKNKKKEEKLQPPATPETL